MPPLDGLVSTHGPWIQYGVGLAGDRVVVGGEPALEHGAEGDVALAAQGRAGVDAVAGGEQVALAGRRVAQVEAGRAGVAVDAVAAVHPVGGGLGRRPRRSRSRPRRRTWPAAPWRPRPACAVGGDLHRVAERVDRPAGERPALRACSCSRPGTPPRVELGLDRVELAQAVRREARVGAGRLRLLEQALVGHHHDQLAALEVVLRSRRSRHRATPAARSSSLTRALLQRALLLGLLRREAEVALQRRRDVSGTVPTLLGGERRSGAQRQRRDHDRGHQCPVESHSCAPIVGFAVAVHDRHATERHR